MTDHIKVDASFIQAIVEDAAWAAANIEISERKTAKKRIVPEPPVAQPQI